MKPGETSLRHGGEKRSRKLDQFIAALMAHPSLEAAADAVGIGRVTAWRWLKDPVVLEKFREARRDTVRHIAARVQEAAKQSVETLCEVQRKGENESVRVTAARVLLEAALRIAETEDVHLRLDLIENNLETLKSDKIITGSPKISVSYKHENGKGNLDGQKQPEAFGGIGARLRDV
jgi:hypothetical protein